ncbi:hypothetical protein TraAM80_01149 [Trypanosoma rangeli]|uniref:Uncharacterized protein n=1 Tax=Trypanosoma rangeli TaxID=5698 RepID=A0A422NZU2_TRYRA|nr:uncharacterized protein TraAM80_01149 [Trypanosoma rangeli]RNF11022.1 hypothetical protein TraAM80_01149 [Trypanosoma rangeli]|eukprot:RNF11022.1 hypothetical protein TraAM80_01149 [Trypanosoma rangeli]
MRKICCGLLRMLLSSVVLCFLSCTDVFSLRHAEYAGTLFGRVYVSSPLLEANLPTRLVDCFPRVVLSPSNITYYCEVSDAVDLSGLRLYASYYTPEGTLCGGWPATLEASSNLILFVPNTAAPSGMMVLVITERFVAGDAQFQPVTTNASIYFWSSKTTHARFVAPFPYYGMQFAWETNMPCEGAVAGTLLVRAGVECHRVATNCGADVGCYNVTDYHHLPLPGNYSLCVTADGWRGHYLPWGQSFLEVKSLVTIPLYVVNGTRVTIKVYDAALGNPLSHVHQVFLAPCAYGACQKSEVVSLENVMHVDSCRRAHLSDRIHYAEDRPLFLHHWKYVVCVELSSCSSASADVAACGVALSALPVTALVNAFALAVLNVSCDALIVGLTGGDLAVRSMPYYLCLLPSTASCGSELNAAYACARSATPNAPFIRIKRSGLELPNALTLCLVAANVTFWGHRYVWTQTLVSVTLKDDACSFNGRHGSTALIVLGAAAAILLAAAIIVVCFPRCLRARRVVSGEELATAPSVPLPAAARPELNPFVAAGQKQTDVTSAHACHDKEGSDLSLPSPFVSVLPAEEDGNRRPPLACPRLLEDNASITFSPHSRVLSETAKPPALLCASREDSTSYRDAHRDTSAFEAVGKTTFDAEECAFVASNDVAQVFGAAAFHACLKPRRGENELVGCRTPSATVELRGVPQHASVTDGAANDGHSSLMLDASTLFSVSPSTVALVTPSSQKPLDDIPPPSPPSADVGRQEGKSEAPTFPTFFTTLHDTLGADAPRGECQRPLPAVDEKTPLPSGRCALVGNAENQTYAGRELSGPDALLAVYAVTEDPKQLLARGALSGKEVGPLTVQTVGAAAINNVTDDTSCKPISVVSAPLFEGGVSTTSFSTETVSLSMGERLPGALCIDLTEQPLGTTSFESCEKPPTSDRVTSLGESECDTVDTLSSLS